MSAYDVQGGDCLFQIKIGDDYFNFICAKSFSLSTVTDIKETTTVGSGFWKEFRPKKLSYTINLSGMVQVMEENDQPIFKSLLQSQVGFLPVDYRLLYIDQSENPMVITGTVYVQNTLITTDPVNLVDGSAQLLGSGQYEISDTIPVYVDVTVEVVGTTAAKCKFILINAQGELAYSTEHLPETAANAGWLIQGQSVTFKVLAGSYYVAVQTVDVNSADNDFDLDTPAPGPIHWDFADNPFGSTTFPSQIHDFTEARTATFTIGEELPPPPCIDVSFNMTPELPKAEVGISYSPSITLVGTAPFNLTINERPSWLNIEIVGNTLQFSGVPDEAGEDVAIDISITNCSSGVLNFSQQIDVLPASVEQSTINWLFGEISANGSMSIYKNGLLIVDVVEGDSGSFNALPGDHISVVVASGMGNMRSLVVSASPGGTLHLNQGPSNQAYEFDVVNGTNYTINGSVFEGI